MFAKTPPLFTILTIAALSLTGCPGADDGEDPCVCPEIYAPVCGDDGETYDNECFASCEGVSVAYEGECEAEWTTCVTGEECGDDEYCARPGGTCAHWGVCESRPEVCTDQWDPVCGCDGSTYGNECEANAGGTSVESWGECETGCACPKNYDPVCGEDGVTYGNLCMAECAGVSISHQGECEEEWTTCVTGDECSDDEYCARPSGACYHWGVCEARPDACYDIWAPVCGCDGNTYGNDCEANAGGTTVGTEGACAPSCDDVTCDDGQHCELVQVYCFTEPCPPQPTCVDEVSVIED